jgi:putative tricarboxylic transport membrane protein
MTMLSPDLLAGLDALFRWDVMLLLAAGAALGSVIGALPGLTATMGIALLTPLTFGMKAEPALAMLLGVYCGAIPGGGISAILVNIPGTPASIAQAWDGYPMSQRGEAGLALGINALMAMIGQIASVLFLAIAAFPIAAFALQFGPPEYFGLALFGISLMAGVSTGLVVKGLLAGTLGLFLGMIGLDPMTAYPRFTFGRPDFLDGISFIPVMIGLFGLGEVLTQVSEKHGEAVELPKALGRVWPRLKQWREMIVPGLAGTGIGTLVGAIPAAGGDIASVISWEQARRLSKTKEQFSRGSIEGLAASTTSCNSVIGGAMTTMLTLGIPGDAPTAVLIGALLIHGLQPGPMLFRNNRPLVFTMVFSMIVAAIVVAVILMLGARPLARVLRIPNPWLWSGIVILCVVGSYALNAAILDVWVMLAAGILGCVCRKAQVPLGPLILGLILGPMMESNLRRGLILSRGDWFAVLSRPIVVFFLAATVLSLLWPVFTRLRQKGSGLES